MSTVPELEEYQFGFHDDVKPIFSTGNGLTEEVVREISRKKEEPEWMLEFRLKSLEQFNKMAMQEWGPDLSDIDFEKSNISKEPATNLLVTGMMYQIKSKKHLKESGFQKPNVRI